MIGALAGAVCAFIPASLNAIPYGFTRAESVAASLNLFAILLMSFLELNGRGFVTRRSLRCLPTKPFYDFMKYLRIMGIVDVHSN